jgi:carboxymethylenebutenolidase
MCSLDGCGHHADLPPIIVPDALRRRFLAGIASLPLAAVLADRALAQAAADRVETVSFPSAGGRTVTGALALPAAEKAPVVLLFHEWWGLNDQIKAVAAEFAAQGYVALAIDLFGGRVAQDAQQAQQLVGGLDQAAATDLAVSAVQWLRGHPRSTGKVGTVGWCFGGGWSLQTSIATPVDATVIYYGNVRRSAQELKTLAGPVLGHFGTQDKSINQEMVAGFEKAMREAGQAERLTVYWYEADHAFANPTGARYDAEDAATAWERTLYFFKKNLG